MKTTPSAQERSARKLCQRIDNAYAHAFLDASQAQHALREAQTVAYGELDRAKDVLDALQKP